MDRNDIQKLFNCKCALVFFNELAFYFVRRHIARRTMFFWLNLTTTTKTKKKSHKFAIVNVLKLWFIRYLSRSASLLYKNWIPLGIVRFDIDFTDDEILIIQLNLTCHRTNVSKLTFKKTNKLHIESYIE